MVVFASCDETTPETQPTAVTYHRDIAPLLKEKCGSCHTQGGIGPFALEQYADAFKWRRAIVAAVESRMMPPWKPSQDCTEYQYDRSLSDEQIALITRWAHEGALEGNPADAPPPAAPPGGLSRVDRELVMPVEYLPTKAPDDYRCFIIDWPETEMKFITGLRGNAGQPSIVHHLVAFLVPPGEAAPYHALDDADPGPGYTCYGGPGTGRYSKASWLGAWIPANLGSDLPPGVGIPMQPGSKIILQVHYNLSNSVGAPDRSSVSVSTAPAVEKMAFVMPWLSPAWLEQNGMHIPAGQPDVQHRFEFDGLQMLSFLSNGAYRSDLPITIYEVGMHMHTLGTWGKLEIVRQQSEAKDCMLHIPQWDFHWQSTYTLKQPKVVNPGDRIALECHWDNSHPDAKDVYFGEGTSDEMCFGSLVITQ